MIRARKHLIKTDFLHFFIGIAISGTVDFTIDAALTSDSTDDTFAIAFKNGKHSGGC